MKLKFKLLLMAGILVWIGVNFQTTAGAASNRFSNKERVVMKGYFSSGSVGYAFHFKTIKAPKNLTLAAISFGDFKHGKLNVGVLTKMPVLSKDRRTLKYTYKINHKQKLSKTNYTMYIKKQSASKYTIWLNKTKKGYLPSTRGKAYRFTRTVKLPAKKLVAKHLRPFFVNLYTKQIKRNLKKQNDGTTDAGKPAVNWEKDPQMQQKIKTTASDAANTTVKDFLKNF